METLHQPNEIINQRYRIVTPLGQGSMGTTYEAEDLTNYQRVAIKAVSLRQATDWKILELFKREGRVLANLNYPNIPNYLDYFYVDSEGDRIFYLVRELIGGDSLANLVKRGWNLEEEKVKQIAIQLLQTLDYLHQLNPSIIHRDLKPANLIVDRSGKVFLVDFGAVRDVYRQTISLSNTFVGTLGYMAPEQFRGQVKPASDLYSLGATLIFVLTGRSPVDLPQIRMKIDFRNRVSISPQFAHWLDKMLEPMLEDRFTSAREALDGLNNKTAPRGKEELVEGDRASSNMVSNRRPQPAGSKIVLKNYGTNLFVEIPKTKTEIYGGVLGYLGLLMPFFFLFHLFRSGEYLPLFFILVRCLVALLLTFLNSIFGKTRIKINKKKLCIQSIFFGFPFDKSEILTSKIDRIEVSLTVWGTKNTCTIFAGACTKGLVKK